MDNSQFTQLRTCNSSEAFCPSEAGLRSSRHGQRLGALEGEDSLVPEFGSSWQQHAFCRLGSLAFPGLLDSAPEFPAVHAAKEQQHKLGPKRVDMTSQKIVTALTI